MCGAKSNPTLRTYDDNSQRTTTYVEGLVELGLLKFSFTYQANSERWSGGYWDNKHQQCGFSGSFTQGFSQSFTHHFHDHAPTIFTIIHPPFS